MDEQLEKWKRIMSPTLVWIVERLSGKITHPAGRSDGSRFLQNEQRIPTWPVTGSFFVLDPTASSRFVRQKASKSSDLAKHSISDSQ
jgi:hypothetical protein